ncbi:unnamed protein product [Darwinula stevensoni]|uniref:CYRIA/CYRIB Rac1 binding domain-containing protein n=1 Tax=Darwinula stevensoni TaxID=69355 RepID=A0A7R9A8W0_9CRUS|nr:unnamed protein product [Darwinula stevensoni]CAG0896780.1 unnamed protein product [Darwinula stevensoni]
MGNLLRLLARDESNCCSPQKYDVYLDFENAQPTEEELPTHRETASVLQHSDYIIQELQQYKGAGKEIREAISNPTEETQQQAWRAVLPLVRRLKGFYEFSQKLEAVVPKILRQLCSGSMTPTQHLEMQQALVKQFAEILEFTLKFDELKMTTPSIQNDFSYFRRTVRSQHMNGSLGTPAESDVISNELANRMSLFYAHATPMLKVLSDATTKFVAENKEIPIENTTETLGTMAKVCQRMIDPDLIARFQRGETQLFVLRVMVGLIILYDHVHPVGAFAKASCVDVSFCIPGIIKGCIKVLKEQPTSNSEGLLNALR